MSRKSDERVMCGSGSLHFKRSEQNSFACDQVIGVKPKPVLNMLSPKLLYPGNNCPSARRTIARWMCVLLLAISAQFAVGSTTHPAERLCGATFEAQKFGFAVAAVRPDEEAGCGRALTSNSRTKNRDAVATIAILSGPATQSLKKNPSNFIASKDGSLKFKLPHRVSDSRRYYYSRSLKKLVEKKESTNDGEMYVAEYLRRVDRLKKISDVEEIEVTETQRCIDAVRTSATATVLLSGCALANQGADLSARMRGLLNSVQLTARP
jgi:hypothetical protein